MNSIPTIMKQLLFVLAVFMAYSLGNGGFAQTTGLVDTTISCGGSTTVTLGSNIPAFVPPTSQPISGDDSWASAYSPIGFTFNFFGNNYTQVLCSTNGILSFNSGIASTYCPWPINAGTTIPTTSYPMNTIMFPWQDLLPNAGGTAVYGTTGTAPYRKFIVQYCNVAYFSCGAAIGFSGQVVLHETTNIIEMHIMNKPTCAGWNGGRAVQGIQNSTGTIGFAVPGRNATTWTATNDAWRFTPNSPTSYTVSSIPFFPLYLANTPPVYTWYALPNNTTPIGTGMPLNVTPTQTTDYMVVSSTSCLNNVFRDTVTVTINNQLNIVANATVAGSAAAGQDITICQGGITTLNAGGAGPGGTYSWSPATGLMTPNDSSSIAAPFSSEQYVVTVTNAAGCSGTDTINITVTTIPVVTVSPASPTICNGQSITLVATGAAAYSWTGPNLSTTSGTTVVANPTSTTTYTVTGTSPGCGPVDGYVTVQVNTPPTLTFNPPSPVSLCQGATANLSISSSDPASTFTWAPTTGLTTSTGPNTTFNGASTQTYTVTATTNGCVLPATIDVNVNPAPTVTWPLPWITMYCQSDPAFTLFGGTGTPAGGTYVYTNSTGTIYAGDQYDPGAVVTGPDVAVNDTVYYIYTDLNGCVNSTYNVYTITGDPVVTITAGPPVCFNSAPVALTGTPAGGTFLGTGVVGSDFIPNAASGVPTAGGNFDLVYNYVSMISGCTGSDTVQQMVWPLPTPVITNLNTQYCIDDVPVRLTGTPDPTSPTGGYFTVDYFVSTMLNPSLTGTGNHLVSYIFTDPNGCTDSTSQSVTINPLPVVSFTGLDPKYCDYDAPATLVGTPAGATGVFSGNGVSGGSFDPSLAVTGTNVVTYTYTNPSTGCVNFTSTPTLVVEKPTADFYATPMQASLLDPVISVNDQSLLADSWNWNFGDDNEYFTTQNATHTYADTGTYTITLIVTNNGCLDTITTDIRIEPEFLFFMPTAFTPNGDSQNDYFGPQGAGVSAFEMVIFDRWGNALYQTTDMNKPWDGKGASQGVYIYKIKAKDYFGKPYEYFGNVSIIN